MHDRPCQMLPNTGTLPDVDAAANRVQLVKRYNCLVGKPGNITRTIQKQFLMHLEVKIVDADGRIVPRGVKGALLTRG